MPAKMACKQSQKALSPLQIDCQNVQLTNANFNGCTVQSVECYGQHGHPTSLIQLSQFQKFTVGGQLYTRVL